MALPLLKKCLCNKLNKKNKVGKLPTLFFLSLLFFYNAQAQYNLVSNPSFEVYTNCPTTNKELAPYPWFYPTNISTCYANACSSSNLYGVPNNTLGGGQNYQYARTGNAYVGLGFYTKILNPNIGGGRNYIEIKLNKG